MILLTNTVLASSADDLAIFCAGFGTVLFLFPTVLLTQPNRAQNQNIKQD